MNVIYFIFESKKLIKTSFKESEIIRKIEI